MDKYPYYGGIQSSKKKLDGTVFIIIAIVFIVVAAVVSYAVEPAEEARTFTPVYSFINIVLLMFSYRAYIQKKKGWAIFLMLFGPGTVLYELSAVALDVMHGIALLDGFLILAAGIWGFRS